MTDWCLNEPCLNNGSCLLNATTGSYSCDCLPGSRGINCSVVDACWQTNLCANGGTCLTGVGGGYTCSCVSGYTGDDCSVVVNACVPSPCLNGASCTNIVNGFSCSCPAGFTGVTCETNVACRSSPCRNGGTCHQTTTAFVCDCATGNSRYYWLLMLLIFVFYSRCRLVHLKSCNGNHCKLLQKSCPFNLVISYTHWAITWTIAALVVVGTSPKERKESINVVGLLNLLFLLHCVLFSWPY